MDAGRLSSDLEYVPSAGGLSAYGTAQCSLSAEKSSTQDAGAKKGRMADHTKTDDKAASVLEKAICEVYPTVQLILHTVSKDRIQENMRSTIAAVRIDLPHARGQTAVAQPPSNLHLFCSGTRWCVVRATALHDCAAEGCTLRD